MWLRFRSTTKYLAKNRNNAFVLAESVLSVVCRFLLLLILSWRPTCLWHHLSLTNCFAFCFSWLEILAYHLEARCWSNIGQISRKNLSQSIHQLSQTCSLNPHLSSTSFAYLFPFLGHSLKPGLDLGLCICILNQTWIGFWVREMLWFSDK